MAAKSRKAAATGAVDGEGREREMQGKAGQGRAELSKDKCGQAPRTGQMIAGCSLSLPVEGG